MIKLESVYFGQRNPEFGYDDYAIAKKVKRLAAKHLRLCEYDCNGEGWVKGKFYRCDNSAAYVGEETVFYVESLAIEGKIEKIITDNFRVEFQHDPRGSTVKLYYNNDIVDIW